MQIQVQNNQEQNSASAARVPWTPEQQAARMLALCEAQMEGALHDSEESVNHLIVAFAAINASVNELRKLAKPGSTSASSAQSFELQLNKMQQQMDSAVVAFQFYDKLTQRLGHVRYSLSTMALFVCDRQNSQHPEHWEKLLYTLGRLYRTAEEREIFDSITGTLSSHAHQQTSQLSTHNAPAGSIELF
jgi:hypothetical protein